jgi:iron(III) transport system substrate-binding protein
MIVAHRRPRPDAPRLAIIAAAALVTLAGCGDGGDGEAGTTLVVYSGRSEELVGPLIETFTEQTGIEVDVLYGDSGSLALQLLEEGDNSPADVFFSQAPGPLGLIEADGRLKALPSTTTEVVAADFRSPTGAWVGVTARARTLVYDTARLDPASLPDSVLDLADGGSELTVGIAPSNASFQDFVSALRLELGDDQTLLFLDGLAQNGVRTYANNVAIVEAVGRGEIDVGLVNHYYNLELTAQDAGLSTSNFAFTPGDIGNLILVSGAGLLTTSDADAEAIAFIEFLLSSQAQRFFVTETFEYPLVTGIEGPVGQPALGVLAVAPFDLVELGEQLSTTLTLIEQAGLVS